MRDAAKLSFTFNESIEKLLDRLKDEEKGNLQGFEAELKAYMLRASMKSTGSLWMKQVLIQYLTKRFAGAAALHVSDTVVEANDKDFLDDHQPASGQLNHDPERAAKKICQHAYE